jgi:hypothetical protein
MRKNNEFEVEFQSILRESHLTEKVESSVDDALNSIDLALSSIDDLLVDLETISYL